MTDDGLYRGVVSGGELSPAENLDTAIIAAKEMRASGTSVWQIKHGDNVILEGDDLSPAIADGLPG
jgi:hypothetical protein